MSTVRCRARCPAAASRGPWSRWRRRCSPRAASRACCTSASPTPRPGTWGCPAAGRSTCSSRSTSGNDRVRGLRGGGRRRMTAFGDFAAIAADDGRAALVTVIEGGDVGAKLLVRADGVTSGGLGDVELDAAAVEAAEELMWAERSEVREVGDVSLFVDVTAPAPRLVIFGAVDYAAALCRLARAAGGGPLVWEPRSPFATRERFPEAEEVLAEWPEQAFARLGGIDRATYIAVLTHDPKLDDAALEIALRSEAPYVGAMGSRRAQAQRRERLLAAGLEEDLLARIAAPIGLDLGAVTPEETALSIMSEVVAVRNGRDGGRLSSSAGRIHEVGA